MKQKITVSVFIFLFLFCILSITASANTSWIWLTRDPRPLLPWAIAGTLVIETFLICFFNNIQVKRIVRPTIFIVLGNLISFLLPYIFVGVTPAIFEESASFYFRIDNEAHNLPFYIISFAFLILTLIIEIPVEFLGIRRSVKSKKRLIVTIIAANVVTTAAIAVIERTVYQGHW